MKTYNNNRGFTLIELLLVVGIAAVLLAVIVPMGIRAGIDAKYGIIQQNATELAGYASQWAEKSIHAQDDNLSEATLSAYYTSLAGDTTVLADTAGAVTSGQWVATTDENNWNKNGGVANRKSITGRSMNGTAPSAPEDCVEEIVPSDKAITNPFTKVSIFNSAANNPGTTPIPGSLGFGGVREDSKVGGLIYFAFAFQGKDSEGESSTAIDADYYAGMGIGTIAALRNGVFVGRF